MKFLTDAQVPYPLVELLRRIGSDVRTAYEEGTEGEADDSRHIIHSRNLGRVLLTFDTFRAESGARVAAELLLRGGKVVQIRGGPDQPLMKALGRLLFHQPEWQPFLATRDGVAVVSDIRNHCKPYTPHEYSQTIRKLDRPHFDEYLRYWEEKGIAPPRRRPRKPTAQQSQMFDTTSEGTPS